MIFVRVLSAHMLWTLVYDIYCCIIPTGTTLFPVLLQYVGASAGLAQEVLLLVVKVNFVYIVPVGIKKKSTSKRDRPP